jgi:hypothetical protein
MLFIVYVCFVLSFAAQSIFAEFSGLKTDQQVCTKELEGIVYNPANYYFDYLGRIAPVLLVQAPLLFQTPTMAKSIIDTFSQTYGVEVELYDAMGNVIDYQSSGPFVFSALPPNMGHLTGRANGVGEAFSNLPAIAELIKSTLASIESAGSYAYQKIVWNIDGRMLYVRIILPKTTAAR